MHDTTVKTVCVMEAQEFSRRKIDVNYAARTDGRLRYLWT